MQFVSILEETLASLSRFIAALMIVLISGLITFEIILRTVFGRSTFIVDEYVGYMVATGVIFGVSEAIQKGEMLRIGLLFDAIPSAGRRVLEILNVCVTVFAVGILTFYFAKFVLRQKSLGTLSATIAETPIWVPATIVTVGMAVIVLQLVLYAIRLMLGAVVREPSSPPEMLGEMRGE
jgi:TRAP-type C4-dicarboxylate transport system permease small subunit